MSPTTRASTPDLGETARDLTVLGLTRLKQAGRLNVRQREQVRRALARAGDALGWAAIAATSEDPAAEIRTDVEKVIADGSRSLKRELATTVAAKESEISGLEEVAASARALSEAKDPSFPAEITYSHTVRDVTRGLITNTETLTVSDAAEAEGAAASIEKNLSRWDRLRTKMLQELEERQGLVNQLSRDRADFVDSVEDLVPEVLVTLT